MTTEQKELIKEIWESLSKKDQLIFYAFLVERKEQLTVLH